MRRAKPIFDFPPRSSRTPKLVGVSFAAIETLRLSLNLCSDVECGGRGSACCRDRPVHKVASIYRNRTGDILAVTRARAGRSADGTCQGLSNAGTNAGARAWSTGFQGYCNRVARAGRGWKEGIEGGGAR